MLNEWSCPFALWLNSPHIRGLLSPYLKHVAYLSSDLNSQYESTRMSSFSVLLRKGLPRCFQWKYKQILHPRGLILFKASALFSFRVNWKQTSPTQKHKHHRWTHVLCPNKGSLLSDAESGVHTNTALSLFFFASRLWPVCVRIAVTHRRKEAHTRSPQTCFQHTEKCLLSSRDFFFFFFFSKGLCELQCAWLVKWGLSLLCQLEAVQSFKYFAH